MLLVLTTVIALSWYAHDRAVDAAEEASDTQCGGGGFTNRDFLRRHWGEAWDQLEARSDLQGIPVLDEAWDPVRTPVWKDIEALAEEALRLDLQNQRQPWVEHLCRVKEISQLAAQSRLEHAFSASDSAELEQIDARTRDELQLLAHNFFDHATEVLESLIADKRYRTSPVLDVSLDQGQISAETPFCVFAKTRIPRMDDQLCCRRRTVGRPAIHSPANGGGETESRAVDHGVTSDVKQTCSQSLLDEANTPRRIEPVLLSA